MGTLDDEAVLLVLVRQTWGLWRLFFFPLFLFSFTSYYRLIHNPHHLKTFLSVKLRDRSCRLLFFKKKYISASARFSLAWCHIVTSFTENTPAPLGCNVFLFFCQSRAETGLCNQKLSIIRLFLFCGTSEKWSVIKMLIIVLIWLRSGKGLANSHVCWTWRNLLSFNCIENLFHCSFFLSPWGWRGLHQIK